MQSGHARKLAGPSAPAAIHFVCAGTKDALAVKYAVNVATMRIKFGKTAINGKHAHAGHHTAAKLDLVKSGNTATMTWNRRKYSYKAHN